MDEDETEIPSLIEILRESCQENPVYAKCVGYKIARYGRVEVKDDNRVYVYSFRREEPIGRVLIIPFENLLAKLSQNLELPKTAFLQCQVIQENGNKEDENEEEEEDSEEDANIEENRVVADEAPCSGGLESFDVLIETEGQNYRQKNFLFLCSGSKGFNFRDRTLFCYGVPFFMMRGRSIPHVVRSTGTFLNLMKSNRIGGVWELNEKTSVFMIWMDDNLPLSFRAKLGVVVEGLDKLEELHEEKKKILIKDTGLVF